MCSRGCLRVLVSVLDSVSEEMLEGVYERV